MPVLKTCYYEVLGIERDATEEDIKKSFRKLALQLHPDKNLDRNEEAKVEFQVLQQAYEVLSNPQERAWYDEHRHAILRGGLNQDFADDSIDIMQFCSSSCYKGFNDDDEGFYTVYRKLFEKITAEEVDAGLEDSDEEIPSFGDSLASYDEDVGPFYAFWESFCTRKNFAWHDEYDTRHAGCRRVSRLMDKENKKLRTEARKDWNQRVRALVDFVKRKDKRVQAWKAEQDLRLKEKEAILAKKFAEDKAKRQQERKKILDSAKNGHATSASHEQLKEMEAWMVDEFGDANEIESDEEDDCLYCEVCNKSFRTDKAFMNHEKSKKHLRQVQILREQMEEEDEIFPEDEHHEAEGEEAKVDENDSEVDQINDTTDTEHPDPAIPSTKTKLPESSTSSNRDEGFSVPVGSQSDVDVVNEGEEDEEEVVLKNFIKIKLKKSDYSDNDEDHLTEGKEGSSLESKFNQNDDEAASITGSEQQTTKKKRRRAVKETKSVPVPKNVEQELDHRRDRHDREVPPNPEPSCSSCRKAFENKNQLFKHLKQFPEHAALKGPDMTTAIKGKKGKNRR